MEPEEVDDLKDNIDYYVECGSEPGFYHDDQVTNHQSNCLVCFCFMNVNNLT